MRKLSKSGKHLNFEDIAEMFELRKESLCLYFSENNPEYSIYFFGDTHDEIMGKLKFQISEVEKDACLNLLAAIEALFRLDYAIRCEDRIKGEITTRFRNEFANSQYRVSLEDVIFEEWKKELTIKSHLISKLKDTFKYRHWLAHGRYWTLKAGKAYYDFNEIYDLATLVNNLPLKRPE